MRSIPRILAVLTAGLAVVSCSTPPGPAPAKPAPPIPADAIAYDDLKSTNRPNPFTGDCMQITPKLLGELGIKGPPRKSTIPYPGCNVGKISGPVDKARFGIGTLAPKDTPGARFFPGPWTSGDFMEADPGYVRRTLLDGKYYAVRLFSDGNSSKVPSCLLIVDPGSPAALLFKYTLNADEAAQFGELTNESGYPNSDNVEAMRKFSESTCPKVEQMASTVLKEIDPGGGSLGAA